VPIPTAKEVVVCARLEFKFQDPVVGACAFILLKTIETLVNVRILNAFFNRLFAIDRGAILPLVAVLQLIFSCYFKLFLGLLFCKLKEKFSYKKIYLKIISGIVFANCQCFLDAFTPMAHFQKENY